MPELDRPQRRRRNLALTVILVTYVISFFQRFAPAGIAADLTQAFDTTAASLGALAATYFYVYTLMQIPTGVFVDTLGPRRILLFGGVAGALGSLLFGLAPSLQVALVGRTLIGLGVSVTFIAMLKFIAIWYEDNRFASLVGLGLMIGNFGSVLAGTPLSWMAQSVGWRGVFIGIAVLSLLLGLGCWLLVSDAPNEPKGSVIKVPRFDRTVVLGGLLQVLRNRATWPAAWVNTGISGSFFAFGGLWAMPFLTDALGVSRPDAARHLSLYFATFAVSCVFIGTISDRLALRKPVLIVGAHLYTAIWLVWLFGGALPLSVTYPLFALMGMLTSTFTLSWACAKEVNPPLLSGMSTSVTNMGGFLAGAILQPLFGWVMDLHWNGLVSAAGTRIYAPGDYRAGMWLLAATAAIGAVASWRIRETGCRNIWTPAT